jgi:hypothetical protein
MIGIQRKSCSTLVIAFCQLVRDNMFESIQTHQFQSVFVPLWEKGWDRRP